MSNPAIYELFVSRASVIIQNNYVISIQRLSSFSVLYILSLISVTDTKWNFILAPALDFSET